MVYNKPIQAPMRAVLARHYRYYTKHALFYAFFTISVLDFGAALVFFAVILSISKQEKKFFDKIII